ncbi:hypothetical protein FA15DRAFT_710677 [Coprinopsis marcescibilis]|uniref:Ribonuclease H1 N-terminal domain-containing protein n=1 Tax=Coprinopsis marcescibilis TaxID=230819 RepID=A0A5C3KBV5_COPMA|nr:hypothetical protein FA15DRAFT_710677 [Coprinopsis marcescibilis]
MSLYVVPKTETSVQVIHMDDLVKSLIDAGHTVVATGGAYPRMQVKEVPVNVAAAASVLAGLSRFVVGHGPGGATLAEEVNSRVEAAAASDVPPAVPEEDEQEKKVTSVYNPNRDGRVPGADNSKVPDSIDLDLLKGYVCASCHIYNLFESADETWYSVQKGRSIGVFQNFQDVVKPMIHGVKGAYYRKYASAEKANAAFDEALAKGQVQLFT